MLAPLPGGLAVAAKPDADRRVSLATQSQVACSGLPRDPHDEDTQPGEYLSV